MHELSIAEEIISIVRQYLPKENNTNVKAVRIKIGKLSNVLPESLLFCFGASIQGTELMGVRLEIKSTPITIYCRDCESISQLEDYSFNCQTCGSINIKILSGDELQLEEIELE